MNVDGERIVSDLVGELEKAWNAADGHSSLFTLVLVEDQHDWQIAAFHNTLATTGAR
jgi:hypothetical protein